MVQGYKQIKLLGQGAFGKCYLCQNPSDHSKWVIKQIDISRMTPSEKREAYNQAKLMSVFDHPNIIKFRDIYTTKNGKLNIVMDYADGGDLSQRIKQQKNRPFAQSVLLDWFVQICLALKHVHDRKVLHRDIKAQNIFLTLNGRVKLGDFGIARVLSRTFDNARTLVGTPYYLSPEIIQNKPYNFKSDIWSLGVLLYEMCALKPPFQGNNLHNLALKIVRGVYSPIPPQFSKDLKNLIAQLLSVESGRRPTIGQVLRTPFIKQRIQYLLTESVKEAEFSHTVLHNQKIPLKFNLQRPVGENSPKIQRRVLPRPRTRPNLWADPRFRVNSPKQRSPQKIVLTPRARPVSNLRKKSPQKQNIVRRRPSQEIIRMRKEKQLEIQRQERVKEVQKRRIQREQLRSQMKQDIKHKKILMKKEKQTVAPVQFEPEKPQTLLDAEINQRARFQKELSKACSEIEKQESIDFVVSQENIDFIITQEEIVDRQDQLVQSAVLKAPIFPSFPTAVCKNQRLQVIRNYLQDKLGYQKFQQAYQLFSSSSPPDLDSCLVSLCSTIQSLKLL